LRSSVGMGSGMTSLGGMISLVHRDERRVGGDERCAGVGLGGHRPRMRPGAGSALPRDREESHASPPALARAVGDLVGGGCRSRGGDFHGLDRAPHVNGPDARRPHHSGKVCSHNERPVAVRYRGEVHTASAPGRRPFGVSRPLIEATPIGSRLERGPASARSTAP